MIYMIHAYKTTKVDCVPHVREVEYKRKAIAIGRKWWKSGNFKTVEVSVLKYSRPTVLESFGIGYNNHDKFPFRTEEM